MKVQTDALDLYDSLNAVWAAFQRTTSTSAESAHAVSKKAQGALLGAYFTACIWSQKSGEGVVASVTTSYGYDQDNMRVRRTILGSATTTYPNQWFNYTTVGTSTVPATTTAHILLPDGTAIATVEANGTATSTYWLHLDHLGGTHTVTNASGTPVESTSYLPYGDQRIASSSTTYSEQKKFTGHDFDVDSDLTYAKARYYDQDIGKFLSLDPVVKGLVRDKRLPQVLRDPQSQNAYSYGRNNPIVISDPTGQYGEWGGRQIAGFGTHQYVYWQPDRPDLVSYAALGIPEGTEAFTMGFYNPGSGYLEGGIYYPGADGPNGARNDFERHDRNRQLGRTAQIQGLSGKEEAGAINAMGAALRSFNNTSVRYPSYWNLIQGSGVNSNSGMHTLAMMANLESQFTAFNPPGYSSGAQLYLPSGSYTSSQISAFSTLAFSFTPTNAQQYNALQGVISSFATSQTTPATRN